MASTIIIKNKNTGAPSSLAAGELAINTEDGGFYYGSTGGTSVSSSIKFGALTSSTFTNTGDAVIGGSVGATAYNSTTSATGYKLNGVKFLWRDGGADLQVGNTAHKTDIIGTNIDLQAPVTASMISASAGFTGSNAFFDGNITSSGTISASGMIQTAGAISSSTGITASDAFFSGHVTASNLSIAGGIGHTENTNTSIAFGENRIDLIAGGTTGISVGSSGVASLTAGGALNIGAHAFTAKQLIANVADGTAPLTITSTTVVANLNADKLDGADLIDEDNMASNSATAVPTQQSVKAYVDANAGFSGNKFATDLKVGRDADNLIDFTTDNQVTFRVSAGDGIIMKASGEIEATKFDGALEGNADTATTATNATHVTVTDNENTNEENLIPFIEDASATGNVGLESDGDFAYNPSTGTVSATVFKGNIDAVDGDFDGTLEADAITLGGATVLASIDEDDMASNSATKVPTQQSVKAYVDKRVITLFSHAFGISRNTVVGSGNPMTDIFIQGNTIWGVSDRAWVGQYGTGTGNILSGFDPTHIQNGITVPFDITNIRADVQLQSNKGATDDSESGSLFLFKHPYTGSAVANTTVNLIPIAMNSTIFSVNAETSYPVFSVSSSALLTGGNDNVVSASRGDLLVPMYRENVDASGGHVRGNFIITAEKV